MTNGYFLAGFAAGFAAGLAAGFSAGFVSFFLLEKRPMPIRAPAPFPETMEGPGPGFAQAQLETPARNAPRTSVDRIFFITTSMNIEWYGPYLLLAGAFFVAGLTSDLAAGLGSSFLPERTRKPSRAPAAPP